MVLTYDTVITLRAAARLQADDVRLSDVLRARFQKAWQELKEAHDVDIVRTVVLDMLPEDVVRSLNRNETG